MTVTAPGRRGGEGVGGEKGERDLTAALIGAPASRNVATSLQEEAAMRMGLREANQHFSRAVKAVKAGQEVVLTERGKPIAVIRPLRPTDPANAAIERLAG